MPKIFTWDNVRYSIPEDYPLILLPTGELLSDDCKSTGINLWSTGNLTLSEEITLDFDADLELTAKLYKAILAAKLHLQPMDPNIPADIKGYDNCPNCGRKLNHSHFEKCPNKKCSQILNWVCQRSKR